MAGQYAEMYRRAREALESEAEMKLERPLTTDECNLFRSCGTLTMLESLGMLVYCTESSEELARKLSETSMESRFMLALKETVERIERMLGRALTPGERQHMRTLGNTEELWKLEEQMNTALPDERPAVFASLVSAMTKSS